MALKLILIFAVTCLSQVPVMAKKINFEKLPLGFIELYENSDDWIGKPITLHAISSDVRGHNPKIYECYLKHKEEYSTDIRIFTLKMGVAVKGIKSYFDNLVVVNQGQFAFYGVRFRNYWQTIIARISTYPKLLEIYLRGGKFKLADLLIDSSKKKIEFFDVMYAYQLKDLKEHSPKEAEKVESQIQPIRKDIIKKTFKIGQKIKQCASENNF